MARIDSFINALFQFRADRLVLEVGKPATLLFGEDRRPISATPGRREVLEVVINEITPPKALAAIKKSGEGEFEYEGRAGKVRVHVHQSATDLTITICPQSGTGPGSPAAVRSASSLCQPMVAARPAATPATSPAARPAATPPASPAARPAATSAASPAVRPTMAPVASPVAHPAAVASPAPASWAERPLVLPPGAPPIAEFLLKMVRYKCSDLHLTSGQPPLYRKDGEIVTIGDEPVIDARRMGDLLASIMPDRNRKEYEKTHDTDFAWEIPDVARFRFNCFVDRCGPGAVIRQIPFKVPTAEEIGLPPAVLELCNLRKGLVVVTGPTGSGKSTTLAAMVDYINKNRSDHIITIEDPIEFIHPRHRCLVNQREVGAHTESFARALRAALREDPDIVLVGEMRDLETVAIAIETAETGHLVFGTLHTNTAPSTVDRIIDQFPTDRQGQIRTMLADSLKGVVAQNLCKKKGGGRVAALEVLLITPAVSNLIREGKTFQIPSLMQTGRSIGMVTLNDSLLRLVQEDKVEPAEALRKAADKAAFKQMLARINIQVDETA